MGLQKKLNKRLIKKAIGSKYIYQIEAEDAIKKGYFDEGKSKLTGFLKDGVEEMKKEVKKKLND